MSLCADTYTHQDTTPGDTYNSAYSATIVKRNDEYYVSSVTEYKNDTETTTEIAQADQSKIKIRKIYKHTFKKSDIKRVPTMCFRRLQLNHQVGGKHGDEIMEIYGAVCTEWAISSAAGESQIQVNMSGFAYRPIKKLVPFLDTTEYNAYNGEHVMFACLFGSWTAGKDTYISDVQTLRANIKNNVSRILSTCGPVITNYQEGKTEYDLTLNIYSKDALFRDRLFTGGRNPESWMPNYDTVTVYEDTYGQVVDQNNGVSSKGPYGYLRTPLCKNLAPMPQASIVSYDTCRDIEAGQDLGTTIDEADFKFSLMVDQIVFKQMSMERGDSSKLMDNLTSAECRDMWIEVLSDVEDYSNPANDRYNKSVKSSNMIWYKEGNYNQTVKN